MRPSSTADSRIVGSGGAFGRTPRLRRSSFEDSGGVLGDGVDGGGVGRLPRRAGDVEDAAGGGGVEGEAFAQILGVVEPSLLDAQPGLQDPEELLDRPALAVEADGRPRVLGAGLPGAREQQPGGGLRPCGGIGLDGGDREHLQVRLAGPAFGRNQRDAGGAQLQLQAAAGPGAGSAAGLDRDRRLVQNGLRGHEAAQILGAAVRQPDPAALRAAGADQKLRPSAFRLAQKLPDVALAVAHDHGPGAGAGAGQLVRLVEPLQPAPALRRPAAASEVGVDRDRAERAAVLAGGQAEVGGEPLGPAPAAAERGPAPPRSRARCSSASSCPGSPG